MESMGYGETSEPWTAAAGRGRQPTPVAQQSIKGTLYDSNSRYKPCFTIRAVSGKRAPLPEGQNV
jgi:hypothetical protein